MPGHRAFRSARVIVCALSLHAPRKNPLNLVTRSLYKTEGLSLCKTLRKVPLVMPDRFLVFEKVLKKRRRTWKWRVCTPEGGVVMQGSESSRPAARYHATRALFLLLLSAPYQSRKLAARAKAVSKVTLGLTLLVLSELTTSRQTLADLLFSPAGAGAPRAARPKAAG